MTIIPHVHASCVEKDGRGILLRGHSGAGKSSFALALINRGFTLVADDQVGIFAENNQLQAQPVEPLAGMLEVRGVGLLRMNYTCQCQLLYQVDLVPGYRSERLPGMEQVTIQNIGLRSFQLNPMDPRSIDKVLVLFHQDFIGFYQDSADQNGEMMFSTC